MTQDIARRNVQKMLSKSDKLNIAVAFCVTAIASVAKGTYVGIACGLVSAVSVVAWHRHKSGQSGPALRWQEIESRFKTLASQNLESSNKSGGPLCAYQLAGTQGGTIWHLSGAREALRGDAERLSRLAGRKLKTSSVTLSQRLQREKDDLDRWLYFLVEIGEADRWSASSIDKGKGQVDTYPYHISYLTQASERACVERMKSEP